MNTSTRKYRFNSVTDFRDTQAHQRRHCQPILLNMRGDGFLRQQDDRIVLNLTRA